MLFIWHYHANGCANIMVEYYLSLFLISLLIYDFTLIRSLTHGQIPNSQWIYDSPANSDLESKLRNYLLELGSDKILGIQVGLSYGSIIRTSILYEYYVPYICFFPRSVHIKMKKS